MCAGLAFGLAPALSVDRSDPQDALRAEIRGASESRRSRRLRGLLVAGQIALCVSLLAGAGLLARSLWAMTTAPLGFDPDHVLTATVQMPPRDYPTPAARIRFLEQFADRLRSLPDVQAVADVSDDPDGWRQPHELRASTVRRSGRTRPSRSALSAPWSRTTTSARCGSRSGRDAHSMRAIVWRRRRRS